MTLGLIYHDIRFWNEEVLHATVDLYTVFHDGKLARWSCWRDGALTRDFSSNLFRVAFDLNSTPLFLSLITGMKDQLAAELNEIAAQAMSRDSVLFVESGIQVIEKYQTLTQDGLLGQFFHSANKVKDGLLATGHAAMYEVVGAIGLFVRRQRDPRGDVVGTLPRGMPP